MKKLLFELLVVLLALPALAQQMTAPPVIQVTETRNEYTIDVTGNGLLTIELYRGNVDGFGEDSELFLTDQAYGSYQYVIQRPMDTSESFNCTVNATAQEENMLTSYVVNKSFIVHGFFLMPTPVIMFNEVEEGLYIDVQGQGNLTVYVTINGVESSVGDQLPFFVPRTYEDQYIYVNAISDGYGNLDVLPSGATDSYMLTAAQVPPEPVVTPKPHFWAEEGETYVVIHAVPGDDPQGVFGEMVVYLYIQGQLVDNPYYVHRTDEIQDLDISAYAVSLSNPDALPSETAVWVYYINPLEPPVPTLSTETPTFAGRMIEEGGYGLSIYPTEPSTIYFRMGVFYEQDGFVFGEWMEYEDELIFIEPGKYRVEAYAVALDKLPSEMIAYELTVMEPTPSYIYDFEEDGIFYKITAEGKVSVCSETTDYNSYSGQVTIPAMVSHDGVTYMVSGIQENAFSDCTSLTGVTIGAYVTTIGNRAFMNCASLTSVTLGDYVITLGNEAFYGCGNLVSVTLGSGLASIGTNAFDDCFALTSVTCKAATPPVMAAKNCFSCYNTATLHVHPAVLDLYQTANYWNQFVSMVAEDKVAPAAGDANGDGKLTISDVSTLINMLLSGE